LYQDKHGFGDQYSKGYSIPGGHGFKISDDSIEQQETESLIPINKDGERIDTVLSKPTPEAWELYQRRAKIQKLCNQFHLDGTCHNANCAYDHDPLELEAVGVMKYILKGYPCPRKGKCRLAKCHNGHICQKDGCQGGKPCKLNFYMHNIDPTLVQWLLPVDQPQAEDSSISDDSLQEGVSM
jgi:hypothetical protein